MAKDTASQFILDNFELEDRLAVVLIDRRSGVVTQRIASANQIASQEFQVWLKSENRSGRDVFLSMNALAADARSRTRGDVATIRHLYLDFDENGTQAVQHLQAREDIPKPNYLVNTSPDHWQVSWRVQGFGKEQAEATIRELAREFGSDPAATDCARVMRIPGFVNHKRHPTHAVLAERLSNAVYTPDQFPRAEQEDRRTATPEGEVGSAAGRKLRTGHLSQSELDWAYAKRALSRGDSPESVVAAIANYRCGDKPDPEYYARLTVRKAAQDLAHPTLPRETLGPDR
jgi:RepB DNA-primase from phage plasmid